MKIFVINTIASIVIQCHHRLYQGFHDADIMQILYFTKIGKTFLSSIDVIKFFL